MGPGTDDGAVRAGDADRESAHEALIGHFTAGRLDLGEFTDRAGAVASARSMGDLRRLFADLPPPHPVFVPPQSPPMPPPPGRGLHPYADPGYAPFGYEPISGRPYSDRHRVVAGLLQIFFGVFGVGRFYAGHNGVGAAQLCLTLCTFLVLSPITVVWGFVDGALFLVGNRTDGDGRPLR